MVVRGGVAVSRPGAAMKSENKVLPFTTTHELVKVVPFLPLMKLHSSLQGYGLFPTFLRGREIQVRFDRSLVLL